MSITLLGIRLKVRSADEQNAKLNRLFTLRDLLTVCEDVANETTEYVRAKRKRLRPWVTIIITVTCSVTAFTLGFLLGGEVLR